MFETKLFAICMSRMCKGKSKTFLNEGDENLVLTWDFQQTKYFIKTMEAGGKLKLHSCPGMHHSEYVSML